jgi:hypothetical protein
MTLEGRRLTTSWRGHCRAGKNESAAQHFEAAMRLRRHPLKPPGIDEEFYVP